jgi:hypothetical protein
MPAHAINRMGTPMLHRSTFAALILAAGVSGASGLEAMLGDARVTLPPPAGFCELTPRYAFDGRTVAQTSTSFQKAGSRLLAVSADCGQLHEARAGRQRRLDDLAQYNVEIAEMEKPPTESIAQVCARTRQAGAPEGDVGARLAESVDNVRTGETRFFGIVAEDKNACYVAILQKYRTEAGRERTHVGMIAVTIISNRSIRLAHHTVYQSPVTIDDLLARLKRNVAALVAANP